MSTPKPSFNPNPSQPKLKLPAGACDAHFHVFGPAARFPFSENRSYTPADAPKESLFAMHRKMGLSRGVAVQSAAHGFDNRAAADLIAADAQNYRGVALLPPSASSDDLKKLDLQGFRGVRYNYMKHLGTGAPMDEVLALTKRLEPLGWHLQVHMESGLIAELGAQLKKSAVPVVIDHMGRVDASLGLQHPDFLSLLKLLGDKKFFVKVSGSERISKQPAPHADARPFARKLVEEFGDRAVWGTDWPHPNLAVIPDDGMLVDLLAEIAPMEAQRQAVLVDNPRRLYKFE